MAAKSYLNPIAEAEQGLADYIREIPAISALFDGKDSSAVQVFAATAEDAASLMKRQIMLGLKQTVVVGFQRTTEVIHGPEGCPAKVIFNVTITSPGLLADKEIRATSDLGCALIDALDGVQFAEPFFPRIPCWFESWSHYADDSKKLVATLEFGAAIFLKRF